MLSRYSIALNTDGFKGLSSKVHSQKDFLLEYTGIGDEMDQMALADAEYGCQHRWSDSFPWATSPALAILYIFNRLGAPWKTQKRIRMLLESFFTDTVQGIPGDEDGGGLSAFVVFSMLGFYPTTAGPRFLVHVRFVEQRHEDNLRVVDLAVGNQRGNVHCVAYIGKEQLAAIFKLGVFFARVAEGVFIASGAGEHLGDVVDDLALGPGAGEVRR
jgi:hypothetical protein